MLAEDCCEEAFAKQAVVPTHNTMVFWGFFEAVFARPFRDETEILVEFIRLFGKG